MKAINLEGVRTILHQGLLFLEKNSPYILTGLGCAGVISTAVMTGSASVKAYESVKAKESEIEGTEEFDQYKEHIFKERFMLTYRFFIPPVIMGATSIACIIGSQSINSKRHAALASLYSLTEATLENYQDKVKEQLSKAKVQKIHDDICEDKLLEHPKSKYDVHKTRFGDTLCYDVHSGRYFTHDINKLKSIINDMRHDLMVDMWFSLNDFYYLIGLESIKVGDYLGWTIDDDINVVFSSKLTDTGEPCLVMDYNLAPKFFTKNGWDEI